jgi:hypothetical protein
VEEGRLQMPDLRVVFLALKLEAEVLVQCPAFGGVSPVMVVFPSGFDVLRELRVAVVENYRSAHEIAFRVGKNGTSTEDLRTAMIHYRSLFEELVQVPTIVKRKEVA